MIADLIITDLDDTLLDEHQRITPRTEAAVKGIMARGVYFTLASGRSYPSMLPYIRQLGVTCPVIAYQGAMIINGSGGEILRRYDIDGALARQIVLQMRQAGIYIQTYDLNAFYFDRPTDQSALYQRLSGIEGKAVGDLAAKIDRPVPKLLCIAEPEVIRAQYERMYAQYHDRLEVTISKAFYLEFTHKQANKGEAARYVAQKLGVPQAKVACVGDSYNDQSMLAFAGTSVCMENGPQEIRRAVDIVAPPHDRDGVAQLLEQWADAE